MPKKAIYNEIVFDVVDSSMPIYKIKTKTFSNKKLIDIFFAVDSKRCILGERDGEEVYYIIGINSVKPL